MKILLLGYGKMGQAIERIVVERGNQVVEAVDDHSQVTTDLSQVDVAIEFSAPEAAVGNIRFGLKHEIPVVCGTTGWLDKLDEIREYVEQTNGTFFYASNFSLGVNLFFRLNKELAVQLERFNYQPEIEEIHHTQKLDSPSGTAITLADGIIEQQPAIKHWVNRASDKADELPIISIREGEVPGTHIVTYRGTHDEISITHKALSREGFALGAVEVAEWVIGRKGILTMEDFLKD